MKYKINEIFESLQGEGANQGKKVIFIRFSGCNLSCKWCDTNHENFTEYTINEIIKIISSFSSKAIIITGGEPTIYDLSPLLSKLKELEYWIGIETNGTNSLENIATQLDYISISPKSDIKNFRCNEVRYVNDNLNIFDILKKSESIKADYYFISPLDQNGYINIKETMELLGKINDIVDNKWRISLQLHKFAGIK